MSYNKQNFSNDEILYADQLNNMDNQISLNETNIDNINNSVNTINEKISSLNVDSTLTVEGAAADAKAVGDALSNIDIPETYTHPTSHPASMITGLANVATTGKYSDLSGTPSTLPNPNALTINGTSYDGSQAVNITTPTGLPTVTSANNGAFLRVVGGQWTTATIANAEEVTF